MGLKEQDRAEFFKISFLSILNYLPGLIILIFSMSSLHFSLKMIEVHESSLNFYKHGAAEILALERSFHDYEEALEQSIFSFSDANQKKAEKKLSNFLELYFRQLDGFKKKQNSNIISEYVQELNDIQKYLISGNKIYSILKNVPKDQAVVEMHALLLPVYQKIESLWGIMHGRSQAEAIVQNTKDTQNWLYWSVITMGLSGFVLVLLNADKLRALTIINAEKRETLRLLERRLAAMEATFDGIGIVDPDGNLTYMNQALKMLHRLGKKQAPNFIGKPWLNLYSQEGRENIQNNVLPMLEADGYWRGEIPMKTQDGEELHAELSLTKLVDGGFIGTARDVTEQKKADKEKQELQDQFAQAQKMEAIGRLAGGIAHDFNNILAAINGNAEFLVEDLDAESKQYGFAQNILKAGTQARGLVDQMLAFSRRKDSKTEQIDLLHSVRETVSMLQASLPKTIEVKTDIDLLFAPIIGNDTQISQVLMNLCVNAKDAMEEDRGVLELSVQAVNSESYTFPGFIGDDFPQQDGVPFTRIEDVSGDRTRLLLNTLACGQDYISLKVRDNGSGMSRAVMEHAFEPFFTTKPVDKGTGLGLATVHGAIVAHQAAMIIDSTIGKGTGFELLFPLKNAEIFTERDEETKVQMTQTGHILIVEDQEDVRMMMVNMVERIGFEVQQATTGLEALDLLRENPETFDLVITDHNMPKMTGLELVYQTHYDFPDMPFILVSGYSEEELQDLMKEHPAIKTILRKPVAKDVLAQEINYVLSKNKPGTMAQAS